MGSLSNRALLVNDLFDVALYAGSRVVSAVGISRRIGRALRSRVSAARSMNDGAYAVGLLTEVVVESNERRSLRPVKCSSKKLGWFVIYDR
jgi:hypothetical protein